MKTRADYKLALLGAIVDKLCEEEVDDDLFRFTVMHFFFSMSVGDYEDYAVHMMSIDDQAHGAVKWPA
jgi:hypothetical protein